MSLRPRREARTNQSESITPKQHTLKDVLTVGSRQTASTAKAPDQVDRTLSVNSNVGIGGRDNSSDFIISRLQTLDAGAQVAAPPSGGNDGILNGSAISTTSLATTLAKKASLKAFDVSGSNTKTIMDHSWLVDNLFNTLVDEMGLCNMVSYDDPVKGINDHEYRAFVEDLHIHNHFKDMHNFIVEKIEQAKWFNVDRGVNKHFPQSDDEASKQMSYNKDCGSYFIRKYYIDGPGCHADEQGKWKKVRYEEFCVEVGRMLNYESVPNRAVAEILQKRLQLLNSASVDETQMKKNQDVQKSVMGSLSRAETEPYKLLYAIGALFQLQYFGGFVVNGDVDANKLVQHAKDLMNKCTISFGVEWPVDDQRLKTDKTDTRTAPNGDQTENFGCLYDKTFWKVEICPTFEADLSEFPGRVFDCTYTSSHDDDDEDKFSDRIKVLLVHLPSGDKEKRKEYLEALSILSTYSKWNEVVGKMGGKPQDQYTWAEKLALYANQMNEKGERYLEALSILSTYSKWNEVAGKMGGKPQDQYTWAEKLALYANQMNEKGERITHIMGDFNVDAFQHITGVPRPAPNKNYATREGYGQKLAWSGFVLTQENATPIQKTRFVGNMFANNQFLKGAKSERDWMQIFAVV